MKRRDFFRSISALTAGLAAARADSLRAPGRTPRLAGVSATHRSSPSAARPSPYVVKDGVKEFHLVAEPVDWEFAPGMKVKCWGYNGRTPGPIIEAVEGDRVRLLVTNNLPEHTTIHWHGLLLPSGMDGVGGMSQPHIQPGETYAYEFPLINPGTFMYHPHADEMTQMAVGMMGMFIVHPKKARGAAKVDRDFAIMLHEWAMRSGDVSDPTRTSCSTSTLFTMNSLVFPAIPPHMVVKNRAAGAAALRQPEHGPASDSHSRLHAFKVTATDGGPIPASPAQWPSGDHSRAGGIDTRDVEFVANVPKATGPCIVTRPITP